MNRNDTLKLRSFLAQFINDQSIRYSDMTETTKADQRAKAKFLRELDEAITLFKKLKVAPYKPAVVPKQIVVGTCPCGKDVTVGERYAVKTEGVTTITRRCDCGRSNDVELGMTKRVQSVNWSPRSCICGEPLRLRSDYAGYGFSGYEGPWDHDGSTRKNRTAKTDCRCGCKWMIQIRFAKIKDGENAGVMQRTLPNTVVQRCRSCAKIDVPGMSPVVPKVKKSHAQLTAS